jgi:hypothetical protein
MSAPTSQQWVSAFSQVLDEDTDFVQNTKNSYLSVVRQCLEAATAHQIAQPEFLARYKRPDRKYKGLIAGAKVFGKHFDRVCDLVGVGRGAGSGSSSSVCWVSSSLAGFPSFSLGSSLSQSKRGSVAKDKHKSKSKHKSEKRKDRKVTMRAQLCVAHLSVCVAVGVSQRKHETSDADEGDEQDEDKDAEKATHKHKKHKQRKERSVRWTVGFSA